MTLLARGLKLLKFCLWVQRPHVLPQSLIAMVLNLLKFCRWVQRHQLLPQFLDFCRFIHWVPVKQILVIYDYNSTIYSL